MQHCSPDCAMVYCSFSTGSEQPKRAHAGWSTNWLPCMPAFSELCSIVLTSPVLIMLIIGGIPTLSILWCRKKRKPNPDSRKRHRTAGKEPTDNEDHKPG